jgi:hypothetical protein
MVDEQSMTGDIFQSTPRLHHVDFAPRQQLEVGGFDPPTCHVGQGVTDRHVQIVPFLSREEPHGKSPEPSLRHV